MNEVWLSKQERQPWRMCPHCGALHDGATGVNEKPGVHLDPDSRATLLICIECGGWGVVDRDAEGGWRLPLFDEWTVAMEQDSFVLALAATKALIERRTT